MKVILKQDVPNLGAAGDIKEVKNGYARNFLIPRGFVMPASAKSQKEQKFLDQVQKQKIAKRKKTATENAAVIDGKEIAITVKTGEEGKLFGSVTNIHIQKELEAAGHMLDKRTILLDEPIKTLGIYSVTLKLHEGVNAQIKVRVQDEEGNIEVQATETDNEAPAPEAPVEEAQAEVPEEAEAENVEEAAAEEE